MSDTIYSVECGFFDAVNEDRVYTAEQMNMPYKRILSEGIFNYLYAFGVSSNSNMTVNVDGGIALLGGKWVSGSSQDMAVPENTSMYPRIDSVILQVNNTPAVRAGRLVYRTGTPAASPSAPAISVGAGDVWELRIANISVAASATSIASADIDDNRGETDCPWVKFIVGNNEIKAVLLQIIAEHPELITTVADGSITTAKLANQAVTEAKIKNSNVTTDKLANGAVTSAKLGASSVTTEKINDGAVTSAKLASEVTTPLNALYNNFNALGLSVSSGKICTTYTE